MNLEIPFLCLSIGGNIGAGKSTVIEKVREKYKNHIIQPSHSKEEKICIVPRDKPVIICAPEATHGTWNGYIAKFYRNPKKYAFRMHAEIMRHFHEITEMSRFGRRLARLGIPTVFLVERCPAEVLSIFVDENMNHFSRDQYIMLLEWAKVYQQDLEPWRSAKYIYINTGPEECFQRINKRKRDGEADVITLNYIRELHLRFQELYCGTSNSNLLGNVRKNISVVDSDNIANYLFQTIDKLALSYS